MPICPICGVMMGKPPSMATIAGKSAALMAEGYRELAEQDRAMAEGALAAMAETLPDEVPVATPDAEPYLLLTNRELVALINGRPGLAVPKKFNKANLIAVLMADDAQV